MSVDGLIAKIKSDFEKWTALGLIQDFKVYTDIINALSKFGENIMVLQDAVVPVKNGKAILPDNFHSMYVGVKCNPRGYYCSEEVEPVLQNTLDWKERTETTQSWNKCSKKECSEIEEKTIVEKTYIDQKQVTWYYDSVQPLALVKGRFAGCHSKCLNRRFAHSEYEVYINNKVMNTNFKDGYVYIQYYGLDKDEEGKIIIPDTPKMEVLKYVEYYAKNEILMRIEDNKEDAHATRLQQKYFQLSQAQLALALTDAKSSTLTPDSFRKLEAVNRKYMYNFEANLPFNV